MNEQENPIKTDEGYFESCCKRFYFYGEHSFKCIQVNKQNEQQNNTYPIPLK
jgi:hypothetical protein